MRKTLILLTLISAIFASHNAHSAPTLQHSSNYNIVNSKSTNAWLEIDVKGFENNIILLQQQLNNKSKICAVMKADAYGNGIDVLMPSIIKLGVPCIGIASNEEAKIARSHGYKGAIARVRTASLDEIEQGLKYNIEEMVGDYQHAKAISMLAKKHGKTIKYHLALNAGGMNRNGMELATNDGKKEALNTVRLPNLSLVGIMTHYSVEDVNFVREALAKFKEQSDWLIKTAKLNRKKITLHTANSFATAMVPESHLDMVRPGVLIYTDTFGDNPTHTPLISFKSRVASVNNYVAGTKVGYDGTYTLTRDSRLANLPFGYSDGYRRAFSNKSYVLIKGHRVPVVGKIAMNTTMVDVTDFPDIMAGDEVVIYGRQGDEVISPAEMKSWNGASMNDLYTIWGNSNPRFIKP